MTSADFLQFSHTSLHGFSLCSGVSIFMLEPCKTSPGKNAIFLSIYLPHLHRKLSDSFGLWFDWQPYPVYSALYVVSVRQTRDLPPTSFRFHLTVDTLVLSYVLGTITRTWDFHPLDCAHAGRTKKRSNRYV